MKICECCGESFTRHAKEAYWQYEARRFCSRPCADKCRNRRVPDDQFKARYRQVKIDGRPILEHRYVMEQLIGRPLESWEQVHHRNHNKLDNSPENLELVTITEHAERHTRHPVTKICVICKEEFTPHKTKRARQQTCGDPACKSKLLSQRYAERER